MIIGSMKHFYDGGLTHVGAFVVFMLSWLIIYGWALWAMNRVLFKKKK